MDAGKKMDLGQFAESVRERLERQGRFESVSLRDVLQYNGVTRHALLLYDGGKNLVPMVYLEPFFGAYRDGADMDEVTGRILDAYGSASCESEDISFLRAFPTVKDRLCMKLVGREANAGLLAAVPHRAFLDMAVAYYVDYDSPQIGAGTIAVHNSHMEMWGVTEKDLWEAAVVNTPERKPGTIQSMGDALAEISAGQGSGGAHCCMGEGSVPMFVISNEEGIYGAAAILYDGILKQAAGKTGSDLFILPSSLHEMIAVPVQEGREAAALQRIVMEVNRKQLQPEEVLTDSVYIYRRAQDRLEIV